MTAPPRLCMRGVAKAFGSVRALEGVDLVVGAGEVHALIGENGAGKSTLVKVLSGAHRADVGEMELDGVPYRPKGPLEARRQGVAMIYQELCLAPHLSVEQNVMLGREEHRLGFARRRSMRKRVDQALAWLGQPELEPDRKLAELGPGLRQLVEVARALVGEARVIVMDEPTSSLSGEDTERLFAVIDRLRERGVAVIYISHFLEEIQRIADRFTVLRDGRDVGRGSVADHTIDEIVALMIGRSLEEVFPRAARQAGEELLRVEELTGRPLPRSASLSVRRGEILGLAGLVGAGRTELLRALFGLAPVRSGQVRIGGLPASSRGPRGRIRQGVGMLSEDRKGEGLALGRSVAENVTLSNAAPFSRMGWIREAERGRTAARWIERLGIRCDGPDQVTGDLSGGNQQKVALARLLHQEADVLLLDEPTRGVDIASKVEIYRRMDELAAEGKAILVVSSYLPELLGICDSIAVMHRGRLGPARPVGEWTQHSLLVEATRGARPH